MAQQIWYDHLGNQFNTKDDMCRQYGITVKDYNNRLNLGWDIEQILTTPVKSRSNSIVYNGVTYNSINDLAKAFNVDSQAVRRRLKYNQPLDDLLKNGVQKQEIECEDHTGRKFSCQADMARAWGMKPVTLRARLNRGMSVEEALTRTTSRSEIVKNCENNRVNFSNSGRKIADHLGRQYNSIKEMADAWDINYDLLKDRINMRGWDIERALTTPCQKRIVKDHLGIEYESYEKMADTWRISYRTLKSRLKSGWDIEKALTTRGDGRSKKCKDHLGNEFNSIKEMCEYHNTPISAYTSARDSGKTVEEALNAGKKTYKDHLGNEFKMIKDMLEYHGITHGAYEARKKLGWTLEKILTTPLSEVREVQDHLGNNFKSLNSMLNTYGIPFPTYKRRLADGWGLEKILTTPVVKSSKHKYRDINVLGIKYESIRDVMRKLDINDIDNTTLQLRLSAPDVEAEVAFIMGKIDKHYGYTPEFIGLNGKAYYKAKWSSLPVTTRQIIKYYRPDLLEAYDKSNPTGKYNPYIK